MKATTACEICCDAFGSGVVCKKCRQDPASKEWVAMIDGDVQVLPQPDRWVVNDLEKRIARELLLGDGSMRGTAKRLGCKPEQVKWFVTRLFSTGRSNARRSDGTSKPAEVTASSCTDHTWQPRSDVGMAMYACTCGAFGRRDVASGAIKPTKTTPEGARPEPTAGSRWKWSDEETMRLRQSIEPDEHGEES